tara:strand:+ start:596 stop:958 length:363 start_codon:yes stop_codon:yes gene_type:complete
MFTLKRINNGILGSLKSMPLKDGTSDNDESFSLNRNQHYRTHTSQPVSAEKKWIPNANRDASSVIGSRKTSSIGLNSMNHQKSPMSFTNTNENNTIKQALQRVRNKGATVPLKKSQQYLN